MWSKHYYDLESEEELPKATFCIKTFKWSVNFDTDMYAIGWSYLGGCTDKIRGEMKNEVEKNLR
jgi:hypothetical protein